MANENLPPENHENDRASEETNEFALSEVSNHDLERYYPLHRDPAYRPWTIPTGPRKPTRYEEVQALMAKYLDYAIISVRVCFIFSMVIVMDYVLPKMPTDV